jgi:hypothetical protein
MFATRSFRRAQAAALPRFARGSMLEYGHRELHASARDVSRRRFFMAVQTLSFKPGAADRCTLRRQRGPAFCRARHSDTCSQRRTLKLFSSMVRTACWRSCFCHLRSAYRFSLADPGSFVSLPAQTLRQEMGWPTFLLRMAVWRTCGIGCWVRRAILAKTMPLFRK